MQRIALYSQDAHGLGRLRRNVAIARALADGEPRSILLISGAGEPAILKLPAGADTLALPAVADGNGGAYGARCLGIDRDGLIRLRSHALRSAFAAFAPDVLIVDRLPEGVGGELEASFEILRELGTQLVLALPEVLGDRAAVQAEWRHTEAFDVVREHYERIWVYGDPLVFDPAEEYELPADVRAMVRYTGYLDGYAATPVARERMIRADLGLRNDAVCVCLAGGTDEGFALAETFARTPLPSGTTGVILTGPFIRPEQAAALEAAAGARSDLRVVGVLPDADTLVWMADQVVAMGGYHTTCEALAAGRRALLVPPASRPDQLVRARRLRDIGAADMLAPGELTAAALAGWIAAGPQPPAALAGAIDTGGLARLAPLLDELRLPVAAAPRRRRLPRLTLRRERASAPRLAAGMAG